MINLDEERKLVKLRVDRISYLDNFYQEYDRVMNSVNKELTSNFYSAMKDLNKIQYQENSTISLKESQLGRKLIASEEKDIKDRYELRRDKLLEREELSASRKTKSSLYNLDIYEKDRLLLKDLENDKRMYNLALGCFNFDFITSKFKELYDMYDENFNRENNQFYSSLLYATNSNITGSQFLYKLAKESIGLIHDIDNSHHTINSDFINLYFNKIYIKENGINQDKLDELYNDYKKSLKKMIISIKYDVKKLEKLINHEYEKINIHKYEIVIKKYLKSVKDLLVLFEPNICLTSISCDPKNDDFNALNDDINNDNSLLDVITNGNSDENEFNEDNIDEFLNKDKKNNSKEYIKNFSRNDWKELKEKLSVK